MDRRPVILVTGASSGIGKACALRLAASGFRVFGSARSAPRLRDTRHGSEGEPFTLLFMDVRDDSSVNESVSWVLSETSCIDVLVNCAGASKYGIEGYSESLQMEVYGFGIRVVVVDPGDVQTEITAHRKETRGSLKDSPYRRNIDAALRSQAASELHGWKVERIARLVERIVRSRSPRFRYTPGPFIERIAPTIRHMIPDRPFLGILRGFYGVK